MSDRLIGLLLAGAGGVLAYVGFTAKEGSKTTKTAAQAYQQWVQSGARERG